MRRLIVLVPLLLIGGYAMVSSGNHAHHRRAAVVNVEPVAVHYAKVARAEAVTREAEALAIQAEQLVATAEAAGHSAEGLEAVASAQATLSVRLDGLLATLQRELARSAETGEPIELHSVQVSAEILAEIAAEFDGAIEIHSDGGDHVTVGSPDGARVEITVR